MKTLTLCFLLSACTGPVVVVQAVDGGHADLDPEVVEVSTEGGGGGSLPIGFYERGCQWDSPACGQPTPGTRLNVATDPVPDEEKVQ